MDTMPLKIETIQARAAVTPETFTVEPHPTNGRLRHLVLDSHVLAAFFEEIAHVDVQNLEYVPFMRFSLANSLLRLLGDDFAKTVRHVVRDRASGGFTMGVQGLTGDRQDFIKFGTAIGHIFGPSNHDAMSGKYYATFLIKHTDNSDSYLRQAAVAMFVEPITRFKDEPFHDAMAAFLRGFDRAMQAIDTKKPENPVAVRALFAGRIRHGWNFERLADEKGFTSETHAGDALNAMFYQPPRFANRGRPSIPDNWDGLNGTMPSLTALVTGAPSSGYLATLFLNLVESSPRAVLLPFVVEATTAWCFAYGIDTNFWSEKEIGGRVCVWLDRTFTADPTSVDMLPEVTEDLMKCLDVLIRSGVAQAREIEERVAARFGTMPRIVEHH
jgi:CsiD